MLFRRSAFYLYNHRNLSIGYGRAAATGSRNSDATFVGGAARADLPQASRLAATPLSGFQLTSSASKLPCLARLDNRPTADPLCNCCSPAVIEEATKRWAEAYADLEGRCQLASGDFFESVPAADV